MKADYAQSRSSLSIIIILPSNLSYHFSNATNTNDLLSLALFPSPPPSAYASNVFLPHQLGVDKIFVIEREVKNHSNYSPPGLLHLSLVNLLRFFVSLSSGICSLSSLSSLSAFSTSGSATRRSGPKNGELGCENKGVVGREGTTDDLTLLRDADAASDALRWR